MSFAVLAARRDVGALTDPLEGTTGRDDQRIASRGLEPSSGRLPRWGPSACVLVPHRLALCTHLVTPSLRQRQQPRREPPGRDLGPLSGASRFADQQSVLPKEYRWVPFNHEGHPRATQAPQSGDHIVTKSVPLGTARQPTTSANGAARRHATIRSAISDWGRGGAGTHTSLASFDASFIGERAVLTIWGELDLLTEPEFRAFLAAVIDCGPGSVELDLGQLNFMDASSLRVIADGTERLRVLGRLLTIRSPSMTVLRVLELSGLTNPVSIGPAEAIELALN